MALFTVFEPPATTGDLIEDAERFKFVPHKFSIWAFLFPLVWLFVYRMWLPFLAYLGVTAVIEGFAFLLNGPAPGVVSVLLALWFGFEAQALRRWSLRRKGWIDRDVVAARDRDTAERRFFETWLDAAPPAPRKPAMRVEGTNEPAVIGMFPDPAQ